VFSDDPTSARQHLRLPGFTRVIAHNLDKADHEDIRLIRAYQHLIIDAFTSLRHYFLPTRL
jgi:hypothetical protein